MKWGLLHDFSPRQEVLRRLTYQWLLPEHILDGMIGEGIRGFSEGWFERYRIFNQPII